MPTAVFLMLRPANYTASTQLQVYVKEIQPGPDLVISIGRADLTQVQNESEFARSRAVLAKVARSLNLSDDPEFASAALPFSGIAGGFSAAILKGLSGGTEETRAGSDDNRARQELVVDALAKRVSVKRVGTSHAILISATTSDPDKSARIANSISQVLLQGRGVAEQDGDRLPSLRERLRGLGPSAFVMTPALAPDRPDGPRKILVLLAAIMAGLVAGSVLALLLDVRDKTIRSARQVESFGLECIGAIPLLRRRAAPASSRTPSIDEQPSDDELPSAPLLEQTLLRATVAIEAADARIVGIASPVAGEGATTVAKHLARMAAGSERKVLLVDLDRRDQPHPLTDAASSGPEGAPEAWPRPPGSNLRRTDGDGPDVLAAEPLDGRDAANWWTHFDRKALLAYDLIFVALPPLERGPEFRMLARSVDGILLVMKWGGPAMERVERAFAVSGAAPSDFIGAVLNMVDDRMIGRFGDKLWEAEAFLAASRPPIGPAMNPEPIAG